MPDGDEKVRKEVRRIGPEPEPGDYAEFRDWMRAYKLWHFGERPGEGGQGGDGQNIAEVFHALRQGPPDGGKVMARVAKKINVAPTHSIRAQQEALPNRQAYASSLMFCVIAKEDMQLFESQVSLHNRWYYEAIRHGNSRPIEYVGTEEPVTNPYNRTWCVSFHAGRAGWDATPISYHEECVIRKLESEKTAYVRAPSAILAIEKGKYLMAGVKVSR